MKEEFVKKFLISILAVVAVLSFMVFGGFSQKDMMRFKSQTEISVPLSIGQTKVKAYIADTEALRQKGLSGRAELSDDEAMLFIFDRPGRYGFWMKDMMFPLDIIWMDEWKPRTDADKTQKNAEGKSRLVVVDVKENVSPATFPEVFTPISPAKYVLETRAGFAEKNELKIGDEISF